MILPVGDMSRTFPLTFEFWFRIDSTASYNILLSQAPKNGAHWELFASPGSGNLYLYVPQVSATENFGGGPSCGDGKWHYVALRFQERALELYADGQPVVKKEAAARLAFDESPLYLGGIAGDTLVCDGAMDELHISRRADDLTGAVPSGPAQATPTTLHLFRFDQVVDGTIPDEAPGSKAAGQIVDRYTRPIGGRFLDEVQDEAYAKSNLHGDDAVEFESRLPIAQVKAVALPEEPPTAAPQVLSLSGEWRMKSSQPRKPSDLAKGRLEPQESEGVKGHWFDPKTDRSDWLPVQVPTSVQYALLRTPAATDADCSATTIQWLKLDFTKGFRPSWDYKEGKGGAECWEGVIGKPDDPWTLIEGIEIDADQSKAVFLKMSVESGGGLQLYFVPTGADINESMSVKISDIPNGEEPTVYQFDMSQVTGWKGKITRLRIDPDGARAGSRVKIYGIGFSRRPITNASDAAVYPAGVPKHLDDPFWDANTYDELQKYGQPANFNWHFRKTRIETREWWFARQFTLPPAWRGKRVRLYCDGIDYAGSVYLNGQSLGYHAGMFGGPEVEVSRQLLFDAPNDIAIRVDPVSESWFGNLKGSPGWGWHYGHLISLGIWRDVQLQVLPDLEVKSPFVKTASVKDGRAVLRIEYYIQNERPTTVQVAVTGAIAGANCDAKLAGFKNVVAAPYGQSRYETEITLEDANLWWPLNYGRQDLYRLALSATAVGDAGPSDTKTVVFGVRTLEMRPLIGASPETDYRWQFVINGVPMFLKGANWCWSDPMLQQDPRKYDHILELARRGGIEMFRAWGGGIIESDIFYDKCDEKGLLVYQEFPFCWQPPDFPLTDGRAVDEQFARVIKRNRNHPSLVMWGGGNENGFSAGADEGLFLVGRRCRQYDPTRPFHRTDPWGGSIHNWGVFHAGEPIDQSFTKWHSPWLGEFGCPSMNNWDETLKFLPESKLKTWPPDPKDGGIVMHMNQFGLGDMVKVMRYADYGPIADWRTYIEYSQMAQGDEIAFAAGVQRAGSFNDKGGLWFYKMTDLFPGHSWAVVGFYGHPKLSYYRAKQVYAPQTVFLQYEKYDWQPGEPFKAAIHVSNDSGRVLQDAKARVVIYGSDLKELWARDYDVPKMDMASRHTLDEIEAKLDPAKIKPFLAATALRDKSGRLISSQWYWFNFRAKSDKVKEVEKQPAWGFPNEKAPEAMKAYAELPEARLLSLPRTTLDISIQREGRKGHLTIGNMSDLPAFNVLIDHFPNDYGDFLDDNSFSLFPNETRIVGFELADEKTPLDRLVVRAWNAPPVKLP
ncbi:MAG: LamG-like jellyroll fold domain-containing protein [Phycisphaerae bacterium]